MAKHEREISAGNGCSVTLPVLLMLLTILQTSAAQTCPVAGSILDCSAAGLTSFPLLPLDVQERVQTLYLDSNNLSVLEPTVFENYTNLRELSLKSNQLTELPEDLLIATTKLTTLNLQRNQLTELPEGLLSATTQLSILWLDKNQLTELPEGLLSATTQLTHLGLSQNQLTELPEGLLSATTQLTHLWLQENQLTELPEGLLSATTQLTRLGLFKNQLTELPEGLLNATTQLTHLWLNENQLTKLSEGLLSATSELKRLYLYGNPLQCDCNLSWLPKTLRGVTESDDGVATATCATPANLTGTSVVSLTEDQFVCEPPQIITTPVSYSVGRGSTVSITCATYGGFPVNISWVRESDSTVLDNFMHFRVTVYEEPVSAEGPTISMQSILEIHHVEKEDESNYTCVALNESGNDTKSFQVFVKDPAQIRSTPQSCSVSRGATASITCAAYGELPVSITWTREPNHTILDTSTNSRVTFYEQLVTKEGLTFSQSTLEVSSVEDMDESNYTCIAVNEFGNDSAVFDLSLDSEGTPDEQIGDGTIIITTTSVGVTLAIVVCLMGAGLLITLRRKCGPKHKSTEAVQERILFCNANAGVPTSVQPTTAPRYFVHSSICDWEDSSGVIKFTQSSLMGLNLTMAKMRKIPGRYVELLDILGKGEFGVVYRAHLTGWSDKIKGDMVAVKTLRGSMFGPRDIEELVKESNRMANLNHPNVLSLIGICIDVGEAPYIVMPFMSNGSLLSHLKKERDNLAIAEGVDIEKAEEAQKCLLSMCLQIAKGMEYLASQSLLHRDLAARNCMIDADFIIKVADFGLSEKLYSRNYFRQRKDEGDLKLPIKWMAIESLSDGVFSEKSDVWSIGVTFWEVFSLGRSPYPGVDLFTLLKYLERGERLEKPSNAACSDAIYDVMMQCWRDDPIDRPTFKSVVQQLNTLLEGIAGYLDLSIPTDGPLAG